MPAILAAFVPFLMAALRLFVVANAVGVVIRVLVGLGVYFFVMEPLGDQISNLVQGRFTGAPQTVVAWLGFLNFDVYIQAILSAQSIVWASNYILRIRQS
jgi:hypothetical protein